MAGPNVVSTAMLQCTFGVAPSTLNVLPLNRVTVGGMPAATIQDHVPIVNIPPFGMCMSLANPTVAAATAAALGVLTPMPCIPATTAPWVPTAPPKMIGNQPVVTADCQLLCQWGGLITIISPSNVQTTTT